MNPPTRHLPPADGGSPTPRLTVAIPLFQAAPWLDTIAENIRRIPRNARILISDETCGDDATERIAERFGNDPRIRLRRGNGSPGWRHHCNILIRECDTEYFSILPQDDLIETAYYEKLVSALDQHRSAGLAFGALLFEGGPFPVPEMQPALPFRTGEFAPWVEAIDLDRQWNLGIPFRGVIRREILRPIPAAPGDRFADKLWVFSLALSSHLIEVRDALYFKRIHARNTYVGWQKYGLWEWKALLAAQVRTVLGTSQAAQDAIARLDLRYQEQIESLFGNWRKLGIC